MSARNLPKRVLHVNQPNHIRVEALTETDPERRADPDYVPIPCMKLRGLWMRAAGLQVGSRMKVETKPGSITLTLVTPPVVEHKLSRSVPAAA